jgi:hypothetical protein
MRKYTLTLTFTENELDIIYDALNAFREVNSDLDLEVAGAADDLIDKFYDAQEDVGPDNASR